MAALFEERRKLLVARQCAMPQQWAANANARLYEIGLEMAALVTPHECTGPLATWGDAPDSAQASGLQGDFCLFE